MYECIPTYVIADILLVQIGTYSLVSFDNLKCAIDINWSYLKESIKKKKRERLFQVKYIVFFNSLPFEFFLLLVMSNWMEKKWSFDQETFFSFSDKQSRMTREYFLIKLCGLLLSLVIAFSLDHHTIACNNRHHVSLGIFPFWLPLHLLLELLFVVVEALSLKFLRNNSLIQEKKLKAKQKENRDGKEDEEEEERTVLRLVLPRFMSTDDNRWLLTMFQGVKRHC